MRDREPGRRSRIRRLFSLGGSNRLLEDVDAELQFHIERRAEDFRNAGVAPAEARARAEAEFGDLTASRRELAEVDRRRLARRSRLEWWSGLVQDVRVAWRGSQRSPTFALTVIITLALGIGATSAVFTLVDAALLRPLPYRTPERLVHIWETRLDDVSQRSEASYPNLKDWRAQTRAFASLDGYNQANLTLTTGDHASRIRGVRVTSGFLKTLGVRLALGRDFVAEEEVRSAGPIVIITDGFWRSQLGARADVLGDVITLDGSAHTIIGVLPAGFHFAPVQDAAVWLPVEVDNQRNDLRGLHWLQVVGRLRDGVTRSAAQTDLATIMQRLALAYPESNAGRTVAMAPLRDVVIGDVRELLVLLLSAVALVLLIACVNVASLLMSRSATRGQELAVRGALGASRSRMVRTLLTESLLLSAIGGALGVGVAWFGSRFLIAVMPEAMRLSMPYLSGVRVNGAALAFTALATMSCGLAAGLAPALTLRHQHLSELIRRGGRSVAGSRATARSIFTTVEIALTVVLLVGTGLLGRSLALLLASDFGFQTNHVLTARVSLSGSQYQPVARQQQFFEDLLQRVRDLPGVVSAGAVSNPPFNGGGSNQFRVEGEAEPAPADRPDALVRGVAGDYFQTLRIRLAAGRVFATKDDSTHPRVVILNETLAARLFPSGTAVGRRLRFYGFEDSTWTIIGVVGDVKTAALDAPAAATIYMSHLQSAENRMSVVLRSTRDPVQLADGIRRELRALDAGLPLYGVETMSERIDRMPEVSSRRFPLVMIAAFGTVALLLAVVGIYGVLAQAVTGRIREFGVRFALGASPTAVVRIVLRQGLQIALIGIAAGCLAAAALTQGVQSLLYGVERVDALTYAAVAVLVLAVTIAASLIPARRALGADPIESLRGD